MSYGESVSHDHDHHDHKPGFIKRWFFSTNHKDIGTLYIIFALVAGLIGGFFSLVMRAELAAPGLDIVADGQAWNVIITAHGLLMVLALSALAVKSFDFFLKADIFLLLKSIFNYI